MENTAKVSVILPVYNVEEYLEKSLKSLLDQSFRDFELICVDDGSTDPSGKILEEWKTKVKDIPFTVIHTENHGLSAARNLGLTYAKGKYIAFIDSDDSVTPDYLEILYREIVESSADLVACRRKKVPAIRQWEKTSSPVIKRFEGDIFGRFLRKEFRLGVEAYGVLYDKNILPSSPYLTGIYYEDYCYFYTRYFTFLNKISLVENDLYMITERPQSIMRSSFNEKKLGSYFTILQEIRRHIDRFPEEYHKKIFSITHNNMLHRMLRDIFSMDDKEKQAEFLKQFHLVFQDFLRRTVLYWGPLRFKYKVLGCLAFLVKNPVLFGKIAKRLR